MKLPKKWRKRYRADVNELHKNLIDMIDKFEGTYDRLKENGGNIPDYHEKSQDLRSIVDDSRDELLQEQDFHLLWDAQRALVKKLDELTSQVTQESHRIFQETLAVTCQRSATSRPSLCNETVNCQQVPKKPAGLWANTYGLSDTT